MTAATFYLPYQRQSAARIPRRDLMLGAADSLSLRVIIVETDHPSAQALQITGGVGGPALRFVIWSDFPHVRLVRLRRALELGRRLDLGRRRRAG
jgi:hypothetical protein